MAHICCSSITLLESKIAMSHHATKLQRFLNARYHSDRTCQQGPTPLLKSHLILWGPNVVSQKQLLRGFEDNNRLEQELI